MQYMYQLQYNGLRHRHYTSYTGLRNLLVRCGKAQARYSTTQCDKHVHQSTVCLREEAVQGSLLCTRADLSPHCIGASVKACAKSLAKFLFDEIKLQYFWILSAPFALS